MQEKKADITCEELTEEEEKEKEGEEEEERLDSAALRSARARVLVYARDGYMYDPSKLAFWTSFLFGFVP